MSNVIAATTNTHKVQEFHRLLPGVFFRPLPDGYDAPEETGTTFEANAEIKALTAAKRLQSWVIADDSGLCIDELDGAPGVYSARFAVEGTDEANRAKVLATIKQPKSKATMVSVVTLASPDGRFMTCRGEVEGYLVPEAGSEGFGYDTIFYIEAIGKTFGQATRREKDTYSHRSIAMQSLQQTSLYKELIMNEIQTKIASYLDEEVQIVERLMGGMSNQMYVIEKANETFTFRIPGKNADQFVDRHIELKAIEAIRSLGINNETVLMDTSNGFKLAEYVEGTPFSQLPDLMLDQAASVLHELHDSSVRFANDYDPFGRLDLYESYHQHQSDEYKVTKAKFLTFQSFLEAQPKVACHNDAQRSNFLQAGDKTYLLDWEFAGNNDPMYDIACFGNIDFAHATSLLPVYLGRTPNQDEMKRLTLWRTFQALQWHNVAWYKDDIGLSQELSVNFAAVATKYLLLAQLLLDQVE